MGGIASKLRHAEEIARLSAKIVLTKKRSTLKPFRCFSVYNIAFILCKFICRQEQFEKSAAGRAARAQLQGMAKQSANSNKSEPVLKVLMFGMLFIFFVGNK